MNRMKKLAVGLTAAVMMVGGAMTAMAANQAGTYFYLLRGGSYAAAPMGQDCVKNYTVSGKKVTLNLQKAEYTVGDQTYTGSISNAYIDKNGNGIYDSGDAILFEKGKTNKIVYSKNANSDGYTNFSITVDIPSYATKTFSVYVPDLN